MSVVVNFATQWQSAEKIIEPHDQLSKSMPRHRQRKQSNNMRE